MAVYRKPLQSVIVKPSGAECNLNCTYCFYLDKQNLYPETKHPRMDDQTLEILIKQLMEQSGRDIVITWQGGEPTLMGLDFFEKVIELEKKYASGQIKNIGNSLQTNGTLINEDWAKFLQENNFLVGLSLDGNELIHDHHRQYKNKIGSFNKVFENLKLLQNHGVEYNILATINDFSVNYPGEIYSFFKTMGIKWMQFIPILERRHDDKQKPAEFSVTPEKYGIFLIEVFKLWLADFANSNEAPSVRFIENFFHRYVGKPSPECTYSKTCGEYVVIEHNGDVFSCDYYVNPNKLLGNIHSERIIDLLNSKPQEKFGLKKNNLHKDCMSCKWLNYCNGGCPKDRFMTASGQEKYYFCESVKRFLSYSDAAFKIISKNWMQNQPAKGTLDGTGYFK